MILGTGVDIIEIDRIEKAASRERFINRVFSRAEKEYWQKMHCAAQTLAGAFAAKEAVAKAFGTGIGEISWQDIEILHTQNNQPYVALHGPARTQMEKMNAKNVHISISHCKQYAVAQAVLEGE